MKSFQVAHCVSPEEQQYYSDLCVLRSNVGWYIGTSYNNPEYGSEPGSRDTGYFHTKEIAENILKQLELFWKESCEDEEITVACFDSYMFISGHDPYKVGYRMHP